MIARTFTDWPRLYPRTDLYHQCSPNLDQLRAALTRRWRMQSLGCHGGRSVRGGTTPSTHTWGAAIDMGYSPDQRPLVETDVLAYLIAWSDEWHISAIHDYRGSRIWRAGRTPSEGDCCSAWWKAQKRDPDGMGQTWANWLHVETTLDGWVDARWEGERGIR